MKRAAVLFLILALSVFPLRAGAVSTSARGAVLINADTGEIIFEQNANERLPMASTTKIMTALLLCEMGDMEKEITVTAEMVRVEGTSMGLLAGDKVTHRALLYGMLLASGNDAANVTAYSLGGTVDGFVKMMNDRAAKMGLENTHFETPSGLDGEEHYTTAYELSIIAKTALENKLFAKACASKTAALYYGNPPYRRTLTNHNKLLNTYPGATGVKTGYTKKSGRCLVSSAEREGKRVIAVTLNDPNDWNDHKALLDYGLEKIITVNISPEKQSYSIPVISAEDVTEIEVKIKPYSVNSVGGTDFDCKVNLPKLLYAPITEGEALGSVVYYKNGEKIAEKVIKAEENVELLMEKTDIFASFKKNLKNILLNIWVT